MSLFEDAGAPRWRIAMVAACPFPAPRGSQVLIRDLAEALAARGHAVHVVTYPHGESLSPLRGIRVHRVRSRGGRRGARPGWRKAALDVALARLLHRVVKEERIDVVHAHNYEAPVVGYAVRALAGVPVVYHAHNVMADELPYVLGRRWLHASAARAGRVLDAQVPRRADFCVALTPEVAAHLVAQGVRPDRVAVVPPAVTAPGAPGPEPAAGPFTITYAGNCDRYQDLDVLWEAVELLRRERPAVAVRLVTHDAAWHRAAGAGLGRLLTEGVAAVVVARGFAAVRREMARAHVLVCPRRSWSGFPIKLVNYMLAGRPVVCAEGSAKGIVPGETGLTFADGSAADLASALRRLHDDPPLRRRLGENARVAARLRHAPARAVAQLEAVYAAVCRARVRAAAAGAARRQVLPRRSVNGGPQP